MTSSKHSDRNDMYLLTGEIIRGWVQLELLLLRWLPELLGTDEVRAHVLWNSYGDLRSKLNLLKTLIRNFADEPLWGEAKEIFAKVEEIAEDRFILAHTFGDVDAVKQRLVYVSDKSDDDFVVNFVDQKSVDTARLEQWVEAIAASQKRIADFKKKLANGVHKESLMHRHGAGSKAAR